MTKISRVGLAHPNFFQGGQEYLPTLLPLPVPLLLAPSGNTPLMGVMSLLFAMA